MSNFLTIATVTATLQHSLQDALSNDGLAATVTTVRPHAAAGAAAAFAVNLYLYQVTPNAYWRNNDLPARDANGSTRQRLRTALDLHYLVTCYGDDAVLEPQRALGSVVRSFHSRPVLTRKMISAALADRRFSALRASNLAEEVEQVKFTPAPLSLEELSKLWSVFFQTHYSLSVAYQASVVFIEPDELPLQTLPVRERNIYVQPFRQPIIEAIESDAGAGAFILADSTLVIRGQQMRGDSTRILINGKPQQVSAQNINNQQIRFPVPAVLSAGMQTLQIVQPIEMGTPKTEHLALESNLVAFVLHPLITKQSAAKSRISLSVEPPVREGQRVVLLLNEHVSEDAACYTFNVTQPITGTSVQIPISDVKSGEYFIRLQVDGAASPLDLNPESKTRGPLLKVP